MRPLLESLAKLLLTVSLQCALTCRPTHSRIASKKSGTEEQGTWVDKHVDKNAGRTLVWSRAGNAGAA